MPGAGRPSSDASCVHPAGLLFFDFEEASSFSSPQPRCGASTQISPNVKFLVMIWLLNATGQLNGETPPEMVLRTG
jgi:hypothetical protein